MHSISTVCVRELFSPCSSVVFIFLYIVLIFHIFRITKDKIIMPQPPHAHRNHPPITLHPKAVFLPDLSVCNTNSAEGTPVALQNRFTELYTTIASPIHSPIHSNTYTPPTPSCQAQPILVDNITTKHTCLTTQLWPGTENIGREWGVALLLRQDIAFTEINDIQLTKTTDNGQLTVAIRISFFTYV